MAAHDGIDAGRQAIEPVAIRLAGNDGRSTIKGRHPAPDPDAGRDRRRLVPHAGSVRDLLEPIENVEVVGTFADGESLLAHVDEIRPTS